MNRNKERKLGDLMTSFVSFKLLVLLAQENLEQFKFLFVCFYGDSKFYRGWELDVLSKIK